VDDKIQRENKLVLEDILEQLDRVSTASGMEPAPAVLRLRTVQHLKHRIEALLKPGVTDMDLLNCLHPTPAVGGAPRQSALEFIRRQETFVRGWYAGALGYVSAHRSEFAVAIRSALIDERGLHLFAGAGIVRGSDPVEEWQELENKIRLPLSLLGFA
jgi:menaquinone-specific isochorismate synthase